MLSIILDSNLMTHQEFPHKIRTLSPEELLKIIKDLGRINDALSTDHKQLAKIHPALTNRRELARVCSASQIRLSLERISNPKDLFHPGRIEGGISDLETWLIVLLVNPENFLKKLTAHVTEKFNEANEIITEYKITKNYAKMKKVTH